MSNKELRRRIRSIKNTSQITKAMEMVAATKMRRAQTQAVNSRPYNLALKQLLLTLLNSSEFPNHPLLQPITTTRSLNLLLTTDKSLCGALNTNLFRFLLAETTSKDAEYVTIGLKGRNFVTRTNRTLIADFPNPDNVSEQIIRQIRQLVTERFLTNQDSIVQITYPHFQSTLTQAPAQIQLLPIDQNKFVQYLTQTTAATRLVSSSDVLIEPDLSQVLDFALLHYLDISILSSLLETKASEHSARMIAMQNASKNAEELVSDLTLTYNQLRQASITNELLEINSAQIALTT